MILTNREIRMRLDNHISQPTKVKNGIAQGAKSSTTLADIYSNSIGGEETQTKSKVVFIDDTLIIHSVQSNEEGTKEAQHLNMIYKRVERVTLSSPGTSSKPLLPEELGILSHFVSIRSYTYFHSSKL